MDFIDTSSFGEKAADGLVVFGRLSMENVLEGSHGLGCPAKRAQITEKRTKN